MARTKHHRTKSHSKKSHSKKSHSKKNYSTKLITKTVGKGVSMVKSTSSKYMPKVKSGLETVGEKVVSSGEKSVPYLQRMTRKMFGSIGSKTKRRKH